ncbi:hypothetical protein NMY22_g120 [Coprinellus aureogranulatus]|nr:hypothetical protein NMY22_g120 [Coprinellus aureogranulatus]
MCDGHLAASDDDGRFSRHDLLMVACIAYSALTMTIWEWMINFEFEVEFLSNSRRRWMKCLYGVSRYVNVLAQIVNSRFTVRMRDAYCPPPGMCFRWFAIQATVSCIMVVHLEVLLMTEVYAMYDRSFILKVFLIAWMSSKSIAMVAILVSVCRRVVFEDVSCVIQSLPVPALAQCGLEIVTAVIIVSLTVYRYRFALLQNMGHPIPLLKLVLRDGLISFAFISGMGLWQPVSWVPMYFNAGIFLAVLIDTKTVGEVCRVILPVTSAIASISTTRIIRNLRSFSVSGCTDVQLTSVRSARSCTRFDSSIYFDTLALRIHDLASPSTSSTKRDCSSSALLLGDNCALQVKDSPLAICQRSESLASICFDVNCWFRLTGRRPPLAPGKLFSQVPVLPSTTMSSATLLRALRMASRLPALRSARKVSAVSSRRIQIPRPSPFSTSSSSKAAFAQELPAQPTVLLDTPSADYIKEEELEVELIPPERVKLVITDRAAEASLPLESIATRENNPDAALRIAVESGGCHGYQYKMELAKSRSPDDYHFSHPTIKPTNILIDAVSLGLLNGSTIDFATELIGSSFRVNDNPQAKGSGCGCGVSWELKD